MKTILAVAAILISASVCAQDTEQRLAKETDQNMREFLYGELLREGDSINRGRALEALVYVHKQRGDLVGAYAYQYLYSQWAKEDEKLQRTNREGQEEKWDRVMVPFYTSIHRETTRLGKLLSADQRKAAIEQADRIY